MPEIKKNQRIARYTVELRVLQPFHIGAFQDPMSDVHNPFTTLGGVPVVQGSSLKGALRAQLEEYLILNYPDQPAMQPCIPAPWNNLSTDERDLVNYRGQKRAYRGESCGAQRGRPYRLCPTCYLLGTMGLIGFVQVPYLYLVSEDDIEEVYQNRRDRATDTVAHGANRTMQAIPQGAVFSGELEVLLRDEIRDWTLSRDRRLKAFRDEWLEGNPYRDQAAFVKEFILDRLEAIPRMGGMISKGFGGVQITVTKKDTIAV
jgi:CRISPR/Cas system CMR subunit Cmr4 (Cas7 group RAMP superfamily)